MSEKVHYLIKEETLQEIAQAVRNKTNETEEIVVSELANKINNIEGGGGIDTSDATAAVGDILAGKTAYVDGEKITGTFTIDEELTTQETLLSEQDAKLAELAEILSNKATATPTLQDKTITPTTVTQNVIADSGYDGLRVVTVNAIPSTYVQPIATKSATTYTPTGSDQTIAAGTYCSGVQIIKGDTNLIPANIVSGKSIFGVNGSAEVGKGDFETATVSVTSYRSDHYICYTGVNEVITQSNFSSLTFTCIKPSVVYLETHGAYVNTTTDIERPQSSYCFIIKGDGAITFTMPGGGVDD